MFFVLILLTGSGALAQLTISGKVMSPDNEPLPGASIVIDGTTTGTVANENGQFTLNNLNKGTCNLRVSFIGYKTFTTKVNLSENVTLSITLQEEDVMTEEVFVLATRAGNKTPVASTQIQKSQIADENMGQDIPYLLSSTPSFVTTSDAGAGVGYTGFRIRGTDANRINVTVNGIPVNDAESQGVWWVNMPDFATSVENIQIQRGVGTSTQGASAFGATINMQTNTLQKDAYAGYNGSAGSFNTFKNSVSIGSGLLKNHFSFDARLSKISSDGFIDRASSDLKSFFVSGGYYSTNTILKLNIFSGKEKTYQAWNGIPSVRLNSDIDGMKRYGEHWLYTPEQVDEMLASNPRTYNRYTYDNETDNYQQDHFQLLFDQKFGTYFNLNAALHYTGGRGYYEQYREDDKFADYGLNDVIISSDTITSTNLIRQKWLDNGFYGGIFSLKYTRNKIDFTFGAGWNKFDGNHFGKIIWAKYASNGSKDYEWYRNKGIKTDFNIYSKVNLSITEKVNLYADIQYRNILYSIDGIDDDYRDITQDHQFDFLNPKLGIFYQPSKQTKAYISWSVGHREPNRDNFVDADPNGKQPTYETLNDFEAGYSHSTPKISASANFYFMDYKNQLILTGEINDVGSAIMVNVDKSYRAGIELILGIKPFANLSWELNATFSQNKITNFTEYVDNWDTKGQDSTYLGTTDIAFSPNVVANSVIDYKLVKNLKISLISQYVGKQYIDNSSNNNRSLNAYFVNNLRIGYTIHPVLIKEIEFHILINNLLNAQYETNAWVYSYIYDGARYKMDGYFPQAGINFWAGINLKF